jgi:hypothetical protein
MEQVLHDPKAPFPAQILPDSQREMREFVANFVLAGIR